MPENLDCNVPASRGFVNVKVKLGIASNVGVDAQKQINKLIFDIFDFDFT